jgi:hypothetical protein
LKRKALYAALARGPVIAARAIFSVFANGTALEARACPSPNRNKQPSFRAERCGDFIHIDLSHDVSGENLRPQLIV